MKRFLLLVCCFFVSLMSFCQDVIITKDAKRIECTISDVSSTEVRYKLWDNQQGPTFVLKTTEINTIIFQNGSVQVFDNQPAPAQTATATSINNQNPLFDGLMGDYGEIQKFGDSYTLNYQGNPTSMDKAAYIRFIQKNSPETWKKYRQSVQMIGAGWGLLCSGITLFAVGVPRWVDRKSTTESEIFGILSATIGGSAALASIPLLTVGYISKDRNYEYYNELVHVRKQLSLNLQSSKDGIGLALHF